MKEIWKEIAGFEGLYEVSNLGRIKTMRTKKIRKPCPTPDGYLHITLSKCGVLKQMQVHRVVAEAFVANEQYKPCVDHINGVRNDNRAENLRWCTRKENVNFELARENTLNSFTAERREAIRKRMLNTTLSASSKQKISAANKGRALSKEHKEKLSKARKGVVCMKTQKPVVMCDLAGNAIFIFASVIEASELTHTSAAYISSACNGRVKTANKHIWYYF